MFGLDKVCYWALLMQTHSADWLLVVQKWIGDRHVAIGTKCNKLLCMNVETYQTVQVPIPPAPARPVALVASQEGHTGCGIHGISLSPNGSLLASGGTTAADCQIFNVKQQPGQAPEFAPHQTLVVSRLPVLCFACTDNLCIQP